MRRRPWPLPLLPMPPPPESPGAGGPAAVDPVDVPPGLHRGSFELPHGITLTWRSNAPEWPAAAPQQAPRVGAVPTVVLLHGFPEAAFAWDAIQQGLSGDARTLAPNLRGYAGSSSPADWRAYRAGALVHDLEALIEKIGAPLDLLVAHDWGGALAWNLAALRPDLMRRLLIVNAPHPATFLRELQANAEQQDASDYMHFLSRPDAGALLEEDGFRRLWPFFERMGAIDPSRPGGAWLDEAKRGAYRQAWSAGLHGPAQWYRASPLKPPPRGADGRRDPQHPLHQLVLPSELLTVKVPTSVLWGEADTALRPALLEGLEAYVPQLEVRRVPGATHWLVHEQPELVIETCRALLQRP